MKEEVIDLLQSKYGINIIHEYRPIVRELTSKEKQSLLIMKEKWLDYLIKNKQYHKDTLHVLEKENADILSMGLLLEDKYKKIFKENMRRIPNLQVLANDKYNFGEEKKIIENIKHDILHQIPIMSNQYGGYSIPENRRNECNYRRDCPNYG